MIPKGAYFLEVRDSEGKSEVIYPRKTPDYPHTFSKPPEYLTDSNDVYKFIEDELKKINVTIAIGKVVDVVSINLKSKYEEK